MIIIVHTKERRKKCSLTPIRRLPGFTFYDDLNYVIPENALLLHPDGPPLTKEDGRRPLVLIDATWKYFKKIFNRDPHLKTYETRSIPRTLTAYPRQSQFKKHPPHYLASIEVIYCVGRILGKKEYLRVLEEYHFKREFLEKNGLAEEVF
jgi:pre-rRNA-processing protein TSR3